MHLLLTLSYSAVHMTIRKKKLMKWKQSTCSLNVKLTVYCTKNTTTHCEKNRSCNKIKISNLLATQSGFRASHVSQPIAFINCLSSFLKTHSFIQISLFIFQFAMISFYFECVFRNYHPFRMWASVWVFALECKRAMKYTNSKLQSFSSSRNILFECKKEIHCVFCLFQSQLYRFETWENFSCRQINVRNPNWKIKSCFEINCEKNLNRLKGEWTLFCWKNKQFQMKFIRIKSIWKTTTIYNLKCCVKWHFGL